MTPPMLRLVWEEHLQSEARQIVKVVDSDSNVVGQLAATGMKYEAQIHGISTITITLNVEEASIESHRIPR